MSFRKGKDCKVTVGANSIIGMGTWEISGRDVEMLETTEFGDQYTTMTPGIKSGGQISFSGLLDPDDSTGQTVLQTAWENGTDVTNLRAYIDNTSYYEANQTGTPSSYVNITSFDISTDKNALATISFSGTLSGKWTLV